MEPLTLFSRDSRQKLRSWTIEVILQESSGYAMIVSTFGQVGGKMTSTQRTITVGKNIGKSNETTPLEQAIAEANSMITKKKEEGYSLREGNPRITLDEDDDEESGSSLDYRPMLAHDWSKQKRLPEYPLITQPKLDGVRMVVYMDSSKKLQMVSRNGKPIECMSHIQKSLLELYSRNLPEDIVLDGELYTTELSFEEITGLTRRSLEKKSKKTLSEDDILKMNLIQYHIFDCFQRGHLDEPFHKRYSRLRFLESSSSSSSTLDCIQLVPCTTVTNPEEDTAIHERYVAEGYEGTIYRIPNGIYRVNYRSKELLKRKDFITEEYTIIGAEEGTGRDSGTVIWKCSMSGSGSGEFLVRPRGTLESRRQYFRNSRMYIGKRLTVRYQNLTEYGIPRFPVGIAIRDYE
jgi:ATP-dependent DNA ligase